MRKPVILLVSSFLPYPLNAGGKIRIYKLCKILSVRYDFILLSLIKDESEFQYIAQLNNIFKEIHLVIKRSKPKSLLYPISYFGSYSEYLIKKFTEILKKDYVDIIHIESNELLYLTDFIPRISTVYTEHDVSALSLRYSYYPIFGSRISYLFDYLRRVNYHRHFYKKLDIIITLSEKDREFIRLFTNYNKPIYCIPTGVDLDYFVYQNQKTVSNRLVFTGWYGHYPNVDAVLYFSKEILPKIKRRIFDIEFLVIGADAPEDICKLSNRDGLRLIGSTQNIRKYLISSTVFVSPLRLGGGVKTKVLEAMAVGLPVVATKKGIEGISAKNNEEFLLADDPKTFTENIIRIFNDRYLREKISINARRLVEREYNFVELAHKLDIVYRWSLYYNKKYI